MVDFDDKPRPSMDEPLPLFNLGEPESNATDAKTETKLEAFERFHMANRDVYRLFRNKCLKLWHVGVRSYGVRRVFESMRYDHAIKTNGDDYKLNNNIFGYYARFLMVKDARFDGFFETRGDCGGVTLSELEAIEV